MFLHASPNMHRVPLKMKNKEALSLVPPLDFLREAKTIKEALDESGRQINFQGKVATLQHFEEIIRKKPTVLHISCHGTRGNENTMGTSFSAHSDLGHFLIFENE